MMRASVPAFELSRTQRHSPARGLEAKQPATRRRNPDRATAVASMRHRHYATGNQGARTTRRSTAGAFKVPGIVRLAEQHRLGCGREPKLGRGCLCEYHEAALFVASDQCAVEIRRVVLEHTAAVGGDSARELLP